MTKSVSNCKRRSGCQSPALSITGKIVVDCKRELERSFCKHSAQHNILNTYTQSPPPFDKAQQHFSSPKADTSKRQNSLSTERRTPARSAGSASFRRRLLPSHPGPFADAFRWCLSVTFPCQYWVTAISPALSEDAIDCHSSPDGARSTTSNRTKSRFIQKRM